MYGIFKAFPIKRNLTEFKNQAKKFSKSTINPQGNWVKFVFKLTIKKLKKRQWSCPDRFVVNFEDNLRANVIYFYDC